MTTQSPAKSVKSEVPFDPFASETIECPYPFYRAMREHAPVYEPPGAGFYIVSRYADAVRVLHDTDTFKSNAGGQGLGMPMTPAKEAILREAVPVVNTMVTNDPPGHSRYRSLVNKAFSARRVAAMEPSIRAIANELVDAFIDDGEVELVSQFAIGLPLTVIADAFGVSRDDLGRFKQWSDDAVLPLGGMITPERDLEAARGQVEFQKYFIARLEERRSEPRDDLLSALLEARVEGQTPLDTPELLSIISQILVAGNETTTNMVAAATLLLIQHPAQLKAVRANHSLIPNLVEEALRYESPVQGLFRLVARDTEVGGTYIPAGARLIVMYGSANRDEGQFPDGEEFDIFRANARTHLAFGQGIHFCLGAPLARMEGVVGFETLLSRLTNIRAAPGKNDFTHTPSFILRGLKHLNLTFDRA